ncbi:hypothetical protein GGQ85_003550 [Nitrobacter vulgaris]|jgi:hypothetical protein|uniref:hypothetical protein n=1 Tax=Nitrobacter vulgaris TaxID=29421 RepID=UPI00285529B9|nr:hypothetical protein [Nitrobacter vulgaris]MDR6305825.1 hypothetical protein [Nitrobacter vulgaris]HJS08960.1 hypothetical protein [Pirellulales bacterium]
MIPKAHVYSRKAIAILIAFLAGSVVFMAFDTTPPYEYDENASFVVPSPANDGDQVTVKWRLKKVNRECPGIAQRVLFDPKTKIILANYDPIPAATSESVRDGYLNRTFALPRGLPSGPIAYRAEVCYGCNPLQQFVKPLCVPTPNLIFAVR